ncbi:hypothetical protein DNTS_001312 [Danionella cerebrum]|uniref:Protein 4.1 n=1 Tax=Danionella cerebrum TaxID=2873325 RepID=A0A553Q3T4_9TELE|nr:hypothetical protein DNTS_001312 [Danionella translucida]
MLLCRVNFLDDTHFLWELEKDAVGQELFTKVCERLDLLEMDYFGLVMWETHSRRVWLDCGKEIRKQIKSPKTEFYFSIKFFPPDPSILAEDLTRYLLCLQLRKDILIGRLPCPSDILVLLGSYTVQATLGDYDPNLHRDNYVSEIALAANQNEDLERKVMDLHSTYRYMSPAQADMLFLENVMGLPMYGEAGGSDVLLGVCSEGLMLFEEGVKTNVFLWPRVLKISHKRNIFLLKMRPSEEDEFDGDVSFSLASYRACKQLWKCSVEHHSFFRNRLQETKVKRLFALGSRFRHRGRTQSVCLETTNAEILDLLNMSVRAEEDDWFQVYSPEKWDINISVSLSIVEQPHQTEAQRARMELVESSEKISDELVIKKSYKVQILQEGSEIIELNDFEINQETMTPLSETVTEDVIEVNGERIQRVVVTKQWRQTQELKMSMEGVERRVADGSFDTFGTLESLEKRLEEVEAIERRLVEMEELRGGIEEVERLEQRLKEAKGEGLQLEKKDGWHLLLDRRPMMLTCTPTEEVLGYFSTPLKTEDDWFIIFDLLPQQMLKSGLLSDLRSDPEEATAEDEREEQQDVGPSKKPIQPLKEEVAESGDQTQLSTVDYGSSQTAELEQGPTEPQGDTEGDWFVILGGPQKKTVEVFDETVEKKRTQWDLEDWFIIFDVSPKGSVRLMQNPTVDMMTDEEVITGTEQIPEGPTQHTRTDRVPPPVIIERRAKQPRRSIEDEWFIIFDVSPTVTVQAPVVEEPIQEVIEVMSICSREQITEPEKKRISRIPQFPVQPREIHDDWLPLFDKEVHERRSFPAAPVVESREKIQRREEQRTESSREQITEPEKKRISFSRMPQFPVQPREIDDDWLPLFDKEVHERRSFPAVQAPVVQKPRQEVIERQWRTEERVIEVKSISSREQITEPEKKRISRIPQFPVQPREIDDDWLPLFDKEVHERRSFPAVQALEVIERRWRTEERVIEVKSISSREQITEPEKKRISFSRIPQFPVQPREIDDDWLPLFDKEVHARRSFPADRSRAFEAQVPRVQAEQTRTKQLITKETREVRYAAPQMFPVGVREVDDVWAELLDPTPFIERSVPSADTEERWWKEQEDRRVRQKQEEERRRGEQEKRKQEMEARRAHISKIMSTAARRQIEDDWFLLFSAAPKKTALTEVPKGDIRAEEEKKGWKQEKWSREEEQRKLAEERRRREEERRRWEDEKWRREEEKMKQMRIEKRLQTRAVRLQTEVEDDWYNLMGFSFKDYGSSSPVASKLRPQILSEQPLTSTPTAQSASFIKTRTGHTLDITVESESATESMLIRKSRTWTKRIEGENIYVRHSILMLEDLDISQEVILKHHASITELKRIFMDVEQEFGPTEWDRRLSSYAPTAKPQLPHANGEILLRMGLMEENGTSALFRTQELIHA